MSNETERRTIADLDDIKPGTLIRWGNSRGVVLDVRCNFDGGAPWLDVAWRRECNTPPKVGVIHQRDFGSVVVCDE